MKKQAKNDNKALQQSPLFHGKKKGSNTSTIEFSPNVDFSNLSGHLVKLSPLPVHEDYNFTLDDDDGVHEFFL